MKFWIPKKLPSDYSERDPGLFENSPKIKKNILGLVMMRKVFLYGATDFVSIISKISYLELSLSQLAVLLPMIQKRALQVAKPYSIY